MTGRTSAPGRGQTCKGYFMIFRLAPKKSYVSNKIHILFMFLQNMNKTLIYFVQVCPLVGARLCGVRRGGVPLFPLRSPPIRNVYREFTTPARACQGSPHRWRSDERPWPPLTAPFVSGFR